MKTFVILLLALVAATGSGFAQNLIAVQNGGEPKFYQQVDDAIVNAQDGDTIYIPGGSWNISQQINKRLHLVGVGYRPDSYTEATGPTILLGTLTITDKAEGGSIQGCYIKGGVMFGTNDSDATLNKYSIQRCFIIDSAIGIVFGFTNQSDNILLSENIIQAWTAIQGSGAKFNCYNNFIRGYIASIGSNSIFQNNINCLSASLMLNRKQVYLNKKNRGRLSEEFSRIYLKI